jgi:hypothetical protein
MPVCVAGASRQLSRKGLRLSPRLHVDETWRAEFVALHAHEIFSAALRLVEVARGLAAAPAAPAGREEATVKLGRCAAARATGDPSHLAAALTARAVSPSVGNSGWCQRSSQSVSGLRPSAGARQRCRCQLVKSAPCRTSTEGG